MQDRHADSLYAAPLDNTTVAAVATPPGTGAIAVVRMTGPDAVAIADRVFAPAGSTAGQGVVSRMEGRTCRVGRILDPADGSVVDEVVLTRFVAPRSYTGEELVEISCHGGNAVKRRILDVLVSSGARPAEPGEFSRRAFLHGKMDLSQAEAVMDLIQASAARTARAAASQLGGALSRHVRGIAEDLYLLLGRLEMSIEYPEHEEADTAQEGLLRDVGALTDRMAAFEATHVRGRMLREGLTIVIAGRPNVGKSSLLNRLAGYERAIVTEIAGTTRDTVEEVVDVDGLPVRLVDTAGMRETGDRIERLGVERSIDAIGRADLVFWVSTPHDGAASSPLDGERLGQTPDDTPPDAAERQAIMAAAARARVVVVAGKVDIGGSLSYAQALRESLGEGAPEVLPFSAVTGEGLDAIRAAIRAVYEEAEAPEGDEVLLVNARHARCAADALQALRQAREALTAGAAGHPALPPDMVSALLREAAEYLAEITGDAVSDRIVDTVFSRFCVGK